jgi:hypothetical protein
MSSGMMVVFCAVAASMIAIRKAMCWKERIAIVCVALMRIEDVWFEVVKIVFCALNIEKRN